MEDDADLVAVVAADYLRRDGPDAIPRLREEEKQAALRGDHLSAEAWHDIAETALQILLHSN